jgi:hypothetical protein
MIVEGGGGAQAVDEEVGACRAGSMAIGAGAGRACEGAGARAAMPGWVLPGQFSTRPA